MYSGLNKCLVFKNGSASSIFQFFKWIRILFIANPWKDFDQAEYYFYWFVSIYWRVIRCSTEHGKDNDITHWNKDCKKDIFIIYQIVLTLCGYRYLHVLLGRHFFKSELQTNFFFYWNLLCEKKKKKSELVSGVCHFKVCGNFFYLFAVQFRPNSISQYTSSLTHSQNALYF